MLRVPHYPRIIEALAKTDASVRTARADAAGGLKKNGPDQIVGAILLCLLAGLLLFKAADVG